MGIKVRISVIVPSKALFDMNKLGSEISNVMHTKTEPDLRHYFKETTEGWKSQPEFFAHHFRTNDSIGVQVYTSDNAYGIVNAGSPSHLIRPRRRGGILKFQPGYSASTRPGSLSSRAYRRTGTFITTPLVHHPGFEARKFDEAISDDYQDKFTNDMNEAFKAGVP